MKSSTLATDSTTTPGSFDRIAGLVLIINLSSVYIFLAGLLQCNIYYITGTCFLILLLYSLVHWSQARQLLLQKYLFAWLLFLLVFPIFHILMGNPYNLRQALLYAYYFVLMLAAVLFTHRLGFRAVAIVFTISLLITVIGIVLSLFEAKLGLFEKVSLISDKRNYFQGRAFGFAMQPNIQARDFTFLFIFWSIFLPRLSERRQLGAFLAFGILILLTGSRAGFVLAILTFLLYGFHAYLQVRNGRLLMRYKPILTLGIIGLILYLSSPLLIRGAGKILPEYQGSYGILERMESLSKGNLTDEGQKGNSTVQERFSRFSEFLELIQSRPFWGYGPGAQERLKQAGVLEHSSHNQYLAILFEMGLFMALYFITLNVWMYLDPRRQSLEASFQSAVYLQFLLVTLCAGLFSNTLLDSRVYYIIIGFLIAFLSLPVSPPKPLFLEFYPFSES